MAQYREEKGVTEGRLSRKKYQNHGQERSHRKEEKQKNLYNNVQERDSEGRQISTVTRKGSQGGRESSISGTKVSRIELERGQSSNRIKFQMNQRVLAEITE